MAKISITFDGVDHDFEAAEIACGVHDRWVERFGGGWNLFRKDQYVGQVLGAIDWSAYVYDPNVKDPDYDPNFQIGRGYHNADEAKRAVERWLLASEAGENSIFKAKWPRMRLGELEDDEFEFVDFLDNQASER